MARILGLFVAAIGLAGCSTTPVVMNYKPEQSVMQFKPAAGPVAVGKFVDERGEGPKWLGAIRGGFGNPLKVLETEQPVSAMVESAFAEGVRARGGSKGAGRYEVRGVIKKLDCSQYVRREAHGIIEVLVSEAATGKEVFRKSFAADVVDGSALSLSTGIFASVDELRVVAQQVLQQVVDKALDDPAFRSAIAG